MADQDPNTPRAAATTELAAAPTDDPATDDSTDDSTGDSTVNSAASSSSTPSSTSSAQSKSTIGSTVASTSIATPQATPTNIAASKNLTQQQSTCFQEGSVPVTIQNASSWNDFGCNLGFYCE